VRKLKKNVWPYQVLMKPDAPTLIDIWCTENLGRRFNDWFSYNSEDKRIYAFKDEATLLVFKLRWSYNG
jgi:hypothetical protein